MMWMIREKKSWEPFIEKGCSFLGSSCQKRLAFKILFGGGESRRALRRLTSHMSGKNLLRLHSLSLSGEVQGTLTSGQWRSIGN